MKPALAFLLAFGVATAPVHAATAPRASVSLLEAAEAAAASGAFRASRAQNTAGVTMGRITEGDKRRSAIAFGLSGDLACDGAALWRWRRCREGARAHRFADQYEGFQQWHDAQCYDRNGDRLGWDTPTKALFAAGVGLELVSLGYLIAHLRSGDDDDPADSPSP